MIERALLAELGATQNRGLARATEPRPEGPLVIAIETDRYAPAPGGESRWEVPVAEISDSADVRRARQEYERGRQRQRSHL